MIELIIYVAIVGFLVWAITTYVKMPDIFKYIIYAIAAVALVYLVMRAFNIQDIPLHK